MYTLMGIASVLVLRSGGGFFTHRNWVSLLLYVVQLAMNGVWNPLFFLTQKIGLALIWIILIDIAVSLATVAFFTVNVTAGSLMVPYFAWCLFATLLNYSIWLLNRDSGNETSVVAPTTEPLKRQPDATSYQSMS